MNNFKKTAISIVLVICMVMALSVTAFAVGRVELTKNSAVTFGFLDGQGYTDYKVQGVTFKLYKIGEMKDDTGVYSTNTDFPGIDYTKDAAKDIITYANGIRSTKTPAKTGTIGSDYKTVINFNDKADKGLYLLVVEDTNNTGTYLSADGTQKFTTNLALVSVPMQDEKTNTWLYDFDVDVKVSKVDAMKENIKVVVKFEDDKEEDRPEDIDVTISGNGENYPLNIKATDDWKTEFNGTIGVNWSVVPDTLDGYTYKVTIEDGVITITYTKIAEEPGVSHIDIYGIEEEEIPNTGLLWWPVAALGAAGLVSVTYGVIRRKGNKDDK